MRKLFRPRYHGIPVAFVAVLLIAVLTASSVLAAFTFLSVTTEVFVDEPLTIEYNLWGEYSGDSEWHPFGDLGS